MQLCKELKSDFVQSIVAARSVNVVAAQVGGGHCVKEGHLSSKLGVKGGESVWIVLITLSQVRNQECVIKWATPLCQKVNTGSEVPNGVVVEGTDMNFLWIDEI